MNRIRSFLTGIRSSGSTTGGLSAPTDVFFSPPCQRLLALARSEAVRLRHNFVGTEHVLLALVGLKEGAACSVLTSLGMDFEKLRAEVEKQVGMGKGDVLGLVPYTPRVKKALALAVKAARNRGSDKVGTEDVLMGLLEEGDGIAARVLQSFDIRAPAVREKLIGISGESIAAGGEARFYAKGSSETLDLSKRYDLYCAEGAQVVTYQNVLFKGAGTIFDHEDAPPSRAEFLQIELSHKQILYIKRSTILRFHEHHQVVASE